MNFYGQISCLVVVVGKGKPKLVRSWYRQILRQIWERKERSGAKGKYRGNRRRRFLSPALFGFFRDKLRDFFFKNLFTENRHWQGFFYRRKIHNYLRRPSQLTTTQSPPLKKGDSRMEANRINLSALDRLMCKYLPRALPNPACMCQKRGIPQALTPQSPGRKCQWIPDASRPSIHPRPLHSPQMQIEMPFVVRTLVHPDEKKKVQTMILQKYIFRPSFFF